MSQCQNLLNQNCLLCKNWKNSSRIGQIVKFIKNVNWQTSVNIFQIVKIGLEKLSNLSKWAKNCLICQNWKFFNIIRCFLSGPRDALHISKSYVLIIAFVHQSPLHQNHKRICLWWLNKHNISITIIQRVYILSHELNMNLNICTAL